MGKNKNNCIMTKLTAKFKLPELQTKTVWVGMYGGHYSAIVFFSEQPVITETTCYDNRKIIIGCMSLVTFEELYPDNNLIEAFKAKSPYGTTVLYPNETEVDVTYKMELTSLFNENGDLYTIDCHLDGWIG